MNQKAYIRKLGQQIIYQNQTTSVNISIKGIEAQVEENDVDTKNPRVNTNEQWYGKRETK